MDALFRRLHILQDINALFRLITSEQAPIAKRPFLTAPLHIPSCQIRIAMKLEWTTEKRKVKDLVPFDFNPRKFTPDKQAKLIASLEEFNLVDILVINLDNTIISGHRRIEALMLSGRGDDIIDVRVPNQMLSDHQVKRYNIIANTHVGEFDLSMLEEHFADIDYADLIDLPDIEADELLPAEMMSVETPKEVIEDEFDELPPIEPITLRGDMYELNGHKLYCADSTDVNCVGALMAGKLATMIFTDPPYNVKVKDISGYGKIQHKEFAMASGEMTRDEFTTFLEKIFSNTIRYSTDGSIHYVCMDWKHMLEINTAGLLYSEMKNLIVWNKPTGGMGTFYRSKHELIFVFKNGKEKHINNFQLGQTGRYRTNVWDYEGMNQLRGQEREDVEDHPTPKPVRMIGDAMLDCSHEGSIVLDLFLGSGATLIAAEQTERVCYGQELAPAYCDLIVRRYARFMRAAKKPFEIKKNGKKLTINQLKEYDK